jgi:predicted tellurium resistance membrane protein TerC
MNGLTLARVAFYLFLFMMGIRSIAIVLKLIGISLATWYVLLMPIIPTAIILYLLHRNIVMIKEKSAEKNRSKNPLYRKQNQL